MADDKRNFLQRMIAKVVNYSTPERTEEGQWVVDPDTTWAQILDQASGQGYLWSGQKLVITRDVAITYASMARCSTLISAVCAGLIANGHLRVVDHTRTRQHSRRIDKVLETLSYSPDLGVTPSYLFWEDCLSDYCLDGNAIVVPSKSMDGLVTGFRRMAPWDGEITYTRDGNPVYRVTPVDGDFRTETIAGRDLIHARWPRLQGSEYSKRTSRQGYAVPPIVNLTPALGIGLHGDTYVLEWFRTGSKSKTHFNYQRPDEQDPLTPEQMQQFTEWILKQARTGSPIVTQDMSSTRIDDTPQDRAAGSLREQQVQEIGRFYGVPAPLLGVNMTQWGSGIEELAKLFYRFGALHHLDRFLKPVGLRVLPRGLMFMADTTELLRGDTDAITKMLSTIMGGPNGPRLATFEESRFVAGLPADPDGTFDYPNDAQPQDGNGNGGGTGHGEGEGGTAQPPPPPVPPLGQDEEVEHELRCSECDKLMAKSQIFEGWVEVKCPRCGNFETHKRRRSRA